MFSIPRAAVALALVSLVVAGTAVAGTTQSTTLSSPIPTVGTNPLTEQAPEPVGIEPDRTKQTLSPHVVGKGQLQIETGLDRVEDGEGAAAMRAWTTPTRLRFGLGYSSEFRVQSNAFTRVRTNTDEINGASDLSLGLKGHFAQENIRQLELGWLAEATLPTGSDEFTVNAFSPSVMATAEWMFSDGTKLALTPGFRADHDEDDYYPTGSLAISAARDVNAQFSTNVGVSARTIRRETRGGRTLMYDLGAAYRPFGSTEVDGGLSWGMKENDPDFEWKIGFSQRFTPNMRGFGPSSKKEDKDKDDKNTKQASDN